MRLTMEADYALRIVHCLAKNGRRMDAKSIAEQSDVTLRFSLKILRKLAGAGLLRSYKGTQGGYELAKPLDQLSLYDVISTVEGEYQLSRCLAEGYCCSCEKPCKFQQVFGEISRDVRKKLESYTFADFV